MNLAKLLKIVGIFLCIIYLLVASKIYWNSKSIRYLKTKDLTVGTHKWSASTPVCIKSQSEDSYRFGTALAINDQYLAVGDPKSNRVIVYSHNDDDKWIRTNEILPPEDSSAFRVGSGFGHDLALDGAILVIGANTTKSKSEIINFEDFVGLDFDNDARRIGLSGGVYRTKLDRKIEVERIDKPTTNSISGQSIDADRGRIAFSTSYPIKPKKSDWEYKHGIWNWRNEFNVLQADGSIKTYSPPVDDKKNRIFVYDIALKNNLLLIGTPGVEDPAKPYRNGGSGLLYNLDTPMEKPQRLAAKNYDMGTSMALSSQFAALGGGSANAFYDELQITLIKRLDNNFTTVIDGVGNVSLDGNILARFRHSSPDYTTSDLLEVFELDEKAIPLLIKEREHIERALLQNGYLIVVEQIRPNVEICIEQLN